MSSSGGSARPVGNVVGSDAIWSADGQSVFYTHLSDLYVAQADGTKPRKILTVHGQVWRPRISPDGKRIRLTVDNPASSVYSLWEASIDGSNLHAVLPGWNNPPAECCGNWTADGRYFVFQSTRRGKTGIWALREGRPFRRSGAEPVNADSRSIELHGAPPQQGRQEAFRDWRTAARGAGPLRCQISPGSPPTARSFSGPGKVFQGTVARLRFIPGSHPVEKQNGRHRTTSA